MIFVNRGVFICTQYTHTLVNILPKLALYDHDVDNIFI